MRPKSKTTNKRSNMETLTTENLRGMRCDCDSPECSREKYSSTQVAIRMRGLGQPTTPIHTP